MSGIGVVMIDVAVQERVEAICNIVPRVVVCYTVAARVRTLVGEETLDNVRPPAPRVPSTVPSYKYIVLVVSRMLWGKYCIIGKRCTSALLNERSLLLSREMFAMSESVLSPTDIHASPPSPSTRPATINNHYQ